MCLFKDGTPFPSSSLHETAGLRLGDQGSRKKYETYSLVLGSERARESKTERQRERERKREKEKEQKKKKETKRLLGEKEAETGKYSRFISSMVTVKVAGSSENSSAIKEVSNSSPTISNSVSLT